MNAGKNVEGENGLQILSSVHSDYKSEWAGG